jgi:hypothetical protein
VSVAPVIARSLKFKVVVQATGQTMEFTKPVVTIGRGPENDIVFSEDSKVSRAHAEVKVYLGQLYVRSVSPKNFILVDGRKIEEKVVTGQCLLQVGDQVMRIEVDQPPTPAQKQNLALQVVSAQQSVPAPQTQQPAPARPTTPKQTPARRASFDQSMGPPPQFDFGEVRPAQQKSRTIIYVALAVVGVGLYWLLGESAGKKAVQEIRMESDALQDIQAAGDRIQELEKIQTAKGQDSIQYKTAEQHYIKGFRDYRNGQYARAIQSFQAALSFYPAHELSQKYRDLSTRKFDELVQQHMMVGRRYKGKGNYRLCQSSFASAMIMLKDPNDRKYKESKNNYEECRLLDEGQ